MLASVLAPMTPMRKKPSPSGGSRASTAGEDGKHSWMSRRFGASCCAGRGARGEAGARRCRQCVRQARLGEVEGHAGGEVHPTTKRLVIHARDEAGEVDAMESQLRQSEISVD